jgi:hypothetical protein
MDCVELEVQLTADGRRVGYLTRGWLPKKDQVVAGLLREWVVLRCALSCCGVDLLFVDPHS